MEARQFETWMQGYIRAWNSNLPEDIGRLFAEDGRYHTAPYRKPWQGRQEIVANWIDIKDEPGDFTFRYEILGVSGQTGFIRGWTEYLGEQRKYHNLWVVKLNEQGECEEFVEWFMEER